MDKKNPEQRCLGVIYKLSYKIKVEPTVFTGGNPFGLLPFISLPYQFSQA